MAFENQQEISEAKQKNGFVYWQVYSAHYSCDGKCKGFVFPPKHELSGWTSGPMVYNISSIFIDGMSKKFCQILDAYLDEHKNININPI